ncbi:Fe-S oxidoreductase [Gemmatimonadetes bacterium T265]|nr:Fe-S oxidoreductase [Gemmatimonadetes bacterium T265]
MTASTSERAARTVGAVGRVALFVPCFVDQFYPRVAIAALTVLERLGFAVDVPESAVCCGQPAANAGFARAGDAALGALASAYARADRVVVLSGSCAAHVRAHAAGRVAGRAVEFAAFLHDDIGVDAVAALGARLPRRVGLHIGCHGLRGLGLARPTELQVPPFNKLRALLETVRGVEFADLARPDECCGFGGTFAVAQPALSAKIGRDRLRDYTASGADVVVSTDMSCMMHLGGLAHRAGVSLPMVHLAEVIAGDS